MFYKPAIIYLGLCLSFLVCYTEWGDHQHSFIFQIIYEVLSQSGTLKALSHPLILAGLLGLMIFIYATLARSVHRIIPWLGVLMLSAVVIMFSLAGILSLNLKIIASTLFFWIMVIWFFKYRKSDPHKPLQVTDRNNY